MFLLLGTGQNRYRNKYNTNFTDIDTANNTHGNATFLLSRYKSRQVQKRLRDKHSLIIQTTWHARFLLLRQDIETGTETNTIQILLKLTRPVSAVKIYFKTVTETLITKQACDNIFTDNKGNSLLAKCNLTNSCIAMGDKYFKFLNEPPPPHFFSTVRISSS